MLAAAAAVLAAVLIAARRSRNASLLAVIAGLAFGGARDLSGHVAWTTPIPCDKLR